MPVPIDLESLARPRAPRKLIVGAGLLALIASLWAADMVRTIGSLPCLLDLAALSQGFAPKHAVCPVSGVPFSVLQSLGVRAFGCADPKRHLGTEFLLVSGAGRARVQGAWLPFDAGHVPVPLVIKRPLQRASVEATPYWFRVTVSKSALVRFAACLPAACAGLVLLVLGLREGLSDSHRLSERYAQARSPYGQGAILRDAIASLLRLIAATTLGMLLLAWGASGMVVSRRITFFPGGAAEFQELHFGRAWLSPDLVPRIAGVLPAPYYGGAFHLFAFYPKEGEILQRYVVAVEEKDLGVLALLNGP